MKFNHEHLNHQEESFRVLKTCTRFNSLYAHSDQKDAIVYLKLRSNGCDVKSAKTFSSKKICMVDTTRDYEGPVRCRTLKVKSNPYTWTANGWKSMPNEYDMGSTYLTSTKSLVNEADEVIFTNHFVKHENRIKEDYKKKIQVLEKYIDEIYNTQKFSGLSREALLNKLKIEKFRLKTGEVTRVEVDPSTIEFKIPKLDPLNFDENAMMALNLETSQTWFKEREEESKEPVFTKRNSMADEAQLISGRVQKKHPTVSLKQTSSDLIETLEDQRLKNISPIPKNISPIPIEVTEADENHQSETEETKGDLYTNLKSQTYNLNRLLEADATAMKFNKMTSNSSVVSPRANLETTPTERNFVKHQHLAEEFNKINYIFMYNDDKDSKEPEGRSSFSKIRGPKNSKSKVKIKKHLNPNAQKRAKENDTRKAQFEKMQKMLDLEASTNVDNTTLEKKRQELSAIVNHYRKRNQGFKGEDSLIPKNSSRTGTGVFGNMNSTTVTPRLVLNKNNSESKPTQAQNKEHDNFLNDPKESQYKSNLTPSQLKNTKPSPRFEDSEYFGDSVNSFNGTMKTKFLPTQRKFKKNFSKSIQTLL